MARVIYRGCFWERSIPYDTARNTDDVRVLTQQAAGPRGGRIWRFGTEMQATQEAPPRFTPALAFGSACGQNGGTDLPARTAPPPHSTTAVSCVFTPSLTICTSSSPLFLLYFSSPSPIPMVLATITADNQNGAPSPN